MHTLSETNKVVFRNLFFVAGGFLCADRREVKQRAEKMYLRLKPLAAHCFCTHTIASHAVTKVLSMIFWDIIVWRNWNCSYFWKDLILDNRDAQLCLAVARYSRKSDQKIQHWSILHAHFLLPVLCLALSSLQKLSFWLPVCKFFP